MQRMYLIAIALLSVAMTTPLASVAAPGGQQAADTPPQLFDNLGNHGRKVSTTSAEAQRYFDQGLTFAFAFNHDEAIRSFREAARLDPSLAMAWWGVALCNGPHINNPAVDEPHAQAAWEALKKAETLAAGASPVEKSLIRALSSRYAAPQPADRRPLDMAYADAMRELADTYPADADIVVLFAEAMMDLRPWDLWTKEGDPQPGTDEIIAALERAMELDPRHPGALHLYIHAVEASPNPGRAVIVSDRLRQLVPGSGHLVHMPSHIDVLVGRWADAIASNHRAIAVDRAYRARSPRQGLYRIYMAHNQHMLAFAAMMDGQSAVALEAARDMVSSIPEQFIKENVFFVDGLLPIPIEVLMRFGRWDEILKEPEPAAYLPVSTAFWRFARAGAFAATNRLEQAEAEQEALDKAVTNIPDEAIISPLNRAKTVLKIAQDTLAGEIALRRGRGDVAIEKLRVAVVQEDALSYMEPPDWIQPVRHSLGAFLLELNRADEAEAVYREDLRRHPDNGWSLYGLSQSLRLRGMSDEAEQVEMRFQKAWERADVRIHASCLCLKGAEKE